MAEQNPLPSGRAPAGMPAPQKQPVMVLPDIPSPPDPPYSGGNALTVEELCIITDYHEAYMQGRAQSEAVHDAEGRVIGSRPTGRTVPQAWTERRIQECYEESPAVLELFEKQASLAIGADGSKGGDFKAAQQNAEWVRKFLAWYEASQKVGV